jgi:CheY-like chemotaxis protein
MNAGGTSLSKRSTISSLVFEALDKVASPAARDTIVQQALRATENESVPDDPDRLSKFVSGALCDATSKVLGNEAADAVLEDLEPLLRLAAVQAREHVSRFPAGTLVPPPARLESGALPIIRLPSDEPADASSAQTPRTTLPYGQAIDSDRLVLVVDDDAPFLSGLTRLLRIEGHDVVTAADGAAALRLCRRLHPGLMLTDLEMPGLDGAELARLVDKITKGRTKIVMLTGSSHAPKSLPWVARVLTKDIRPRELLDTLGELLQSGAREQSEAG